MDRITIAMKLGLVWAIISFLSGCAQTQELMHPKIASQNKKIAAQNQKIDQLSTKLIKAKQANLALKKENQQLKADKLKLMKTNSQLKKHNQELAMKIDMLKILDHRVEEKRKNYSSD
jgi:small-conductance mechanosensitive channel